MSQEYHNWLTVVAEEGRRLAFVADVFRLAKTHQWDMARVDFNGKASVCQDAGESVVEYYTRGFPEGLDDLMSRHPEILLDCVFIDITYAVVRKMKLRNNLVISESQEEVEWCEEPEAEE